MTRIVADASVLAAIAFGEPDAERWSAALDGALVYAPALLNYELASVARKKCRDHPALTRQVLTALGLALGPSSGIEWIDPSPVDVALLANATGLTVYDASYLWVAGFVGADLATKDASLAAAVDAFACR